MTNRSSYWLESITFHCLTDEDIGRSVTNDIENVLSELFDSEQLKPGHYVIYRDTRGVWDQVVIDSACRFVAFRSLDAPSSREAVDKVLRARDDFYRAIN